MFRFFNVPPVVTVGAKLRDGSSRASLLAISRANSNDSFVPGPSAILEDEVDEAEAEEQQQTAAEVPSQSGSGGEQTGTEAESTCGKAGAISSTSIIGR